MENTLKQRVRRAVCTSDSAHQEKSIESQVKESLKELDTDLEVAVKQNSCIRAKQLLQAGASVEFRNSIGRTPLMEAARRGKVGVCRLLISHGADINAVSSNASQYTPLDYAISYDKPEAVTLLLEQGAMMHCPSQILHHQPVFLAIERHPTSVDAFLDHFGKLGDKAAIQCIFDIALNKPCRNEICAIRILRRGFYPLKVQESSCSCFTLLLIMGLLN